MAKKSFINTRNLTKHLNELGAEAHDVHPDGSPMTREEALAALLWKFALGFKEKVRDEEGHWKDVVHKPQPWAMQYIYERKEGKSTPAPVEEASRIRASDTVRELAKERLNRLAVVTAMPLKVKGPPTFKPKG